ncbi:MAG: response regulator [Leptospiraceae bacterium]|nr:response regulator [Leptospiraceae bacterium]
MENRVLVAEDEEINQMFVKEILNMNGFECDIAENGQIAVDLLKKNNNYKFVLLDVRMPVMNGTDAAKIILSDDSINPKPVIIIVTANSNQDELDSYMEIGVDGVLSKPFTLKSLKEVLSSF